MIFQGLYNIFDLYFKEIDLFYNNIDHFFREKVNIHFEDSLVNESNISQKLKELTTYFIEIFDDIGFEKSEIENEFMDPFLELQDKDNGKITSMIELYESKLAPLIYEIFLEKIVDYLVDVKVAPLMLKLKAEGFLTIEFIMELRNLKNIIERSSEKRENLRKYIQIQEKIIDKFQRNKLKIESLEDLQEPEFKLQLLYLLYRIIHFFHLQKTFDFSHIKLYLEENIDEWLIDVPLVTLKNPDIYFCGIYLAKNLNINLDEKKIVDFLLNLYEEATDRYESLIIEATDGAYYFIKSMELMNFSLDFEHKHKLIKSEPRFFESNYLKTLETSQLVVILKIYRQLGISKLEREIKAILEEIELRIAPEGIKQFRDGFVSSEATYYVLFSYFMNNSLEKLKDYDLLSNIVSRIYRNLEFLDFSTDTNYDLVSELFYSIESLKLFNCIETKEMIIHLAKYLFPQEIVDAISISKENIREKAKFRHLKVNRITGETIY
ncbi:MAG: hypothetical protein E3J52_10725 [Promethearchaeota archaeon]|nr:MAG: hypothetical protein E3J52_10725 [Candidatus Lokiarchaeota archaeon]